MQLNNDILEAISSGNYNDIPEACLFRADLACPERLNSMNIVLWDSHLIAQIVHIRKLSKKIMFIDVRISDFVCPFIESEPSSLGKNASYFDKFHSTTFNFKQKLEVLFRWDECGDDLMKESRYYFKVSDIIQIRGMLEKAPSFTFHALKSTMVKKRFWVATSETDACSSLKSRLNIQPELPQDFQKMANRGIGSSLKAFEETDASTINAITQTSPDLCKYWINNQNCPKENSCLYYHPTGEEFTSLKKSWIQERKMARAKRNLEHEQESFDSEKSCDSLQKKAARAQEFSKFLIETYGISYLKSGMGILDIAGGRGEVSFELFTKLGLPVTLVDPRPRKLSKSQARHLKANPDASLPPHIQEFFKPEDLKWKTQEGYSLVIGMHPDQATDLIVDYAINSNIPFAIVPCCVFAREFSHRLLNGLPVTNYSDLLKYLHQKPPSSYDFEVQICTLDFQGKNKVIYSKPK
ncbi:hypothetical protein DSO57_1009628 [Entomophthora muscae]|uniref:Uncharacterized protein n=1 Tax=Entomophthora muscae TaxID=34485 RepID=A0ACC2U4I1_9FUNG|nr:hypothetical protein DSO57_1009628 [Entomophthora muscae]